jgi:transposase-like protein
MTKFRRTYTREFKLEAVRLWQTSGRSAAQIERDLGIGGGCYSLRVATHPPAGLGRFSAQKRVPNGYTSPQARSIVTCGRVA